MSKMIDNAKRMGRDRKPRIFKGLGRTLILANLNENDPRRVLLIAVQVRGKTVASQTVEQRPVLQIDPDDQYLRTSGGAHFELASKLEAERVSAWLDGYYADGKE